MNPALKYTLGRLGLFAALFVVLLPIPVVESLLVKAMIALLISAVLSLFLLKRWRDEMAQQLTDAAARRRAERERLRAALAGDDDNDDDHRMTTAGTAATAAERAAASATDALHNGLPAEEQKKP